MRLKYRKDISLQEAWNEVLGKKTTKKKLKINEIIKIRFK